MKQSDVSRSRLPVIQSLVKRGQVAGEHCVRVMAIDGDRRAYLIVRHFRLHLDSTEPVSFERNPHLRPFRMGR